MEVSEDGLADVEFTAGSDEFFAETNCSTTETNIFVADFGAFGCGYATAFGFCSFGDNDNGKVFASFSASVNNRDDVVNIVWYFGDETDFTAACYRSIKGNSPGIASHYFEYKDTVMACCCGDEFIDGFGGNLNRSLKTEGHISSREVVVYCFWDTDDR